MAFGFGMGFRFGTRQGGGGFSPHFWLDSNAESDGDGSEASPFKLLASAISAVNSHGNGAKLAVVTDSHFRAALSYTSSLTNVETRGVGSGARPIFDGSRIISAGAITAHASYANVYQVNVTHETATAPSGGANGSNTFHIALYEDETLLTEQFASGTIDTNVQSVRDTPGSYTAHKVGSTTADPRTDTGGTQYTYYFHLTDSGDPRSNGAVMAYAEQAAVALFGNNAVWDGLEFRRAANKDMTGMAASAYAGGGSITNCVFRDPGCHGGVLRPARFVGNYCYGRQDGRSKLVGGGGINFYFNESEGVYSTPIEFRNNYVESFSIGYYSHGNASGFPVHESVLASNNRAVDCASGYDIDLSLNGGSVSGLSIGGAQIGITVRDAAVTFDKVSYLTAASGDSIGIRLYADGVVTDSSFVFATSGAAHLVTNELAESDNSADVLDVSLTNVSSSGGKMANTARRRQLNFSSTDSVIGNLATQAAGPTYTSITADNSYLSDAQRTVAEMATAGATLTDCLSPWQIETISVVPTSDDVRFTNTTRTATEADSPSTIITMNFTSVVAETAIRILDYDGASTPFDTYIKTRIDVNTSNGQVELEDTTPGNFSAKAVHEATYNKAFDFETQIRNYHATRTTDGPSVEVDFGSGSYDAQQDSVLWRITGAITTRKATTYELGNGTTVICLDAANGIVDQAFSVNIGDTLRVTVCALREADDVTWAGDPESTGVAILDPSSPLYALGMGRQAA